MYIFVQNAGLFDDGTTVHYYDNAGDACTSAVSYGGTLLTYMDNHWWYWEVERSNPVMVK